MVYDLNQEVNCSINFRDANKENLESCSGEIEHKYQKPGIYVPIFYANNFILTAKLKNSEDDGGLSAYDASLRIYTDDGESIGASLMGESWAQEYTHIWAGNSHADDLSELILDLNNYKTIKYVLKDNKFTLYSDGKKLYTLPFSDTFGKIVGISVSFKGSGTLDNVNIYNENNESVYNNDF